MGSCWEACCGFALVGVIWHPFGRMLGPGGRKAGQRDRFLGRGSPVRLKIWACVSTFADGAYLDILMLWGGEDPFLLSDSWNLQRYRDIELLISAGIA